MLGDGTIASAGGKVVKNVAGYDLARLVCGSRGRLALIARASFRLHPLPKATRTLVVEIEDTPRAVAALLRSQLQPSALDVLHPGRVAVLFEGSERAVSAQLEAARQLVGGAEADMSIWDESRTRQADARARVRFDPGQLEAVLQSHSQAVARPAAGVAYVPDSPSDLSLQGPSRPPALDALVERIARELDPAGVLSG